MLKITRLNITISYLFIYNLEGVICTSVILLGLSDFTGNARGS